MYKSYYEDYLRLNPLLATSLGDPRYNDQLPNTITQEHRNRVKEFYTRYRTQLLTFDPSTLSDNDRLSYDILMHQCDISLEGLKFNDDLMPMNQLRSLPTQMAQLASGTGNQPFKTVTDYENWIKRVDAFLPWCDSAIANMRKGMKSGFVIPKVNAEKMIPQLANFDHGPVKDHMYYMPIKKFPADFSPEDTARLAAAYRTMIESKVIPAYQKLRTFAETEYLPACRQTSGIDGVPQGKEFYAYLLKRYTTTNMTADEIFALGQKEVARISEEMEKVKQQVGFKGDLPAFFDHLRTKKELRPFKSGDEVVAAYYAIYDKMKPNLERLFDKVPKMKFEVRPIEKFREATSAAHYMVGTTDGSRPGIFYFPLRNVNEYSTMAMEDLFVHEAIPGHHYQIALKAENTDLPEFRRALSETVFSEGWGLYAESLGKELGLYQDPYSYMGMLSGEMHRAIRLVVDAGLHSQGWTREQAIDYFKEHGPQPENAIISEIERYMANPGQAVAYKVGQLKILELRAKAEKELGDRFDIKQFHNEMLDAGSLPLNLLEQKIDRYIQRANM
ncbi:MAG: DUF885 domain-containing protein [Cyclobacteriaceae bacterium]|nr:DUF885 domain-containing protein [Cyclobacteriaceae bacterium]